MAPASPGSSKPSITKPGKRQKQLRQPGFAAGEPPEVIDPIWLLKAGGIVIAAALVCGYLTLCLLFYQGQWQLVLHPDQTKPAPTDIGETPIESVRFGVDESGSPQMTGWWIPASPSGKLATETLLYLPSGDGSLSDAQPRLAALHSLGINIFAFNYRGYGQSAAIHPNEHRMTEDTQGAWKYLTVSRGVNAATITLFGDGVGASLAAHLAASTPGVHGLILQSPQFDLLETVRADSRGRLLPVRALFHENFKLFPALSALKTPKLFLLSQDGPGDSKSLSAARSAAPPRMIVTLPRSQQNQSAYLEQITRFLDQLQSGKSDLQ